MNIRKYYLFGLLPMLIFTLVMVAFKVDGLNITIFLLGFVYPYSLHTPGLREKIARDQYRFSFLRFSLLIYQFAYDRLPKFKQPVASMIYPMIFSGVLMLMTHQMNLHYCLLGWVCWMLFCFVDKKKKLNLVID